MDVDVPWKAPVPEAKLVHGETCGELAKVEAVGGSGEIHEGDVDDFGLLPEVVRDRIRIWTGIKEKTIERVDYSTRRSWFCRDRWVRTQTRGYAENAHLGYATDDGTVRWTSSESLVSNPVDAERA